MMLELWQAAATAAQSSGGGFELGPFASALSGTAVGALLSLAVFRGRLDVYAAKFEALEKRLSEQRAEDKATLDRTVRELQTRFELQCQGIASETRAVRETLDAWTREARGTLTHGLKDSARREEFLLELVLGIAHKQGVRHRYTDVLAQLSAQGENEPRDGR